MAEENKHPPTTEEQTPPEMPGNAPEKEQAEIPDVGAGPAPSAKVIDLSAVRSTPEKDAPPDIPKETEAPSVSVTEYSKQEWEKPMPEPEKPKPKRGRPAKAEKATPTEPGAKKEVKAEKPRRGRPPKTEKTAPEQTKPPKAGKTHAAPEEKAAPPAPEVPPTPRDATRAEKEEIVYLDLSDLHPFKDHPFGVRDDAEMKSLVESVRNGGVNQPALVRPREGGGYEIIAGHRRQMASQLAGYRNMPCIVRNMTDDEAILAMTDDNLRQRETILPSEKAMSLKMQYEAIKHQGARGDSAEAGKLSLESVGQRNGMSVKTVQRYLINGAVETECPQLRIIEPELFEQAQELRQARTCERGGTSLGTSSKALLTGLVYCAHCGNRLSLTSSGRTHTYADGHTVKEVRPRYSCFYKIRHPGDCDGQSGYGVSKLDSIVEEVVRQIFAQFREVSRKKLLESVKTNDAARIQKKVKKIQKDLEAKQKELDDLKAETILVIRGVSALDKELLGTLVAEAREALETLEKQLVQAQEEYEEATKTAKRSNYICNELFTWADVYDTANHDERRAILQQFIKEIRVRKDYEISITLNASFDQVEQLKAVSTYDGAEIFEEISEKGA